MSSTMTSFQHLPGRDRLLCRAPPDLVPVIAFRDDFLALMKPQWLVVKDIMYVIYMNSLHFYEVPPGSAGALSFRLTQPVLGPSPESTSKHRRSPFSSSLAVWTLKRNCSTGRFFFPLKEIVRNQKRYV